MFYQQFCQLSQWNFWVSNNGIVHWTKKDQFLTIILNFFFIFYNLSIWRTGPLKSNVKTGKDYVCPDPNFQKRNNFSLGQNVAQFIWKLKHGRSLSLYFYNWSHTLLYVKYTQWINIAKVIATFYVNSVLRTKGKITTTKTKTTTTTTTPNIKHKLLARARNQTRDLWHRNWTYRLQTSYLTVST